MARIELENFRNFTKKTIDLKTPTIIVGPNAAGKTNIIEALFLISTTNSFKKSATQDLIKRKKDYCKVVYFSLKEITIRSLTAKPSCLHRIVWY